MKEFITAATAVAEADENGAPAPVEFKIDDHVATAYYPGDGQFAVLMAMTDSRTTMQEQIAGVLNFFDSVLDEHTQIVIRRRLLDRTDPFDVFKVQDILMWLVSEWSGRPTKQPADYLPSQRSGGRKSTRRTPVSSSST